MKLITLAQARAHVRVDHNVEDAQLEEFVEAASHAVVNYLKSGADVFLNTLGLPEEIFGNSPAEVVAYAVPPEVQAATKLLVAYFFRNRDGREPDTEGWQQGYLPAAVTALLYPLRDPALA